MSKGKVTDLTIDATTWRGYERGGAAHDGPWTFTRTITAEDADSAARALVIAGWASGTHSVLVVNSEEAREFRITIETEEVTSHE
jgi:hypothetical protein